MSKIGVSSFFFLLCEVVIPSIYAIPILRLITLHWDLSIQGIDISFILLGSSRYILFCYPSRYCTCICVLFCRTLNIFSITLMSFISCRWNWFRCFVLVSLSKSFLLKSIQIAGYDLWLIVYNNHCVFCCRQMLLYQDLSNSTFLLEAFTLDMNPQQINFSNLTQAEVVIELCYPHSKLVLLSPRRNWCRYFKLKAIITNWRKMLLYQVFGMVNS